MIRRAVLISTCALLAAAALPGVAAGRAGFSAPVRLPDSQQEPEWHFAVNDHGQAVAVRVGEGRTHLWVYRVSRSGRLGRPWRLAVPGYLPAGAPTVALDDRGRVALAIDVDEHGPHGPHTSGSGEHVTIASWHLGQRPPALQALTPQGDEAPYSEDQLGSPEIVIGPTSITALWTAERAGQEQGIQPAQVQEAFGAFGGQLQAVKLATVTAGGGTITHLALAPGGAPLASWVDGQGRLATVKGNLTGALSQPLSTQTIPHFGTAGEFANNAVGDTALVYLTTRSKGQTNVMLTSGHDGKRFGHPRFLGAVRAERLVTETLQAFLTAGGREAMLALWGSSNSKRHGTESAAGFRIRNGRLHGRLGPPQHVGPEATGFIGPPEKAVIVYNHELELSGEGIKAAGVRAVSAPVGGRFSAPQSITPHANECRIPEQFPVEPEPIATSRNGHAIFAFNARVPSISSATPPEHTTQ